MRNLKSGSLKVLLVLGIQVLGSCYAQKSFTRGEVISSASIEELPEASGLAPSHVNPGMIWTHNDSGDLPRIFLLEPATGRILSTVYLEGIENRDWEDIATGPGPDGTPYVFIGEIGDNRRVYDKKHIHYFPEPKLNSEVDTIREFGTYSFNLPDEKRDSEALTIDPETRDILLFSKWEPRVVVYKIPFREGDYGQIETLGKVGFTLVVAAEISPAGNELLLKTYEYIFLITREEGQSWAEAILGNSSKSLPYKVEKQGESICWDMDAKGYYTLSEQVPELYYARRSD